VTDRPIAGAELPERPSASRDALGYALFHTAIGDCGIAWSARGVSAIQLPEPSDAQTRARLRRRSLGAREAAMPLDVRRAADGIAALVRGEAPDLSGISLDMDGVPDFHRRVYEVARRIPRGVTLSYGDIAERLEMSGSARDVGRALGDNPFPIVVPCHRVVAANGALGGFSARGGVATKLRLLSIEGVRQTGQLPLFEGDSARLIVVAPSSASGGPCGSRTRDASGGH
jgi:methylated-DNA-[protein]-cysteine S-methyltransferase